MTQAIEKALEIAGIGIIGVFIFMAIFYLLILALDTFLPYKEEVSAEGNSVDVETEDETQN